MRLPHRGSQRGGGRAVVGGRASGKVGRAARTQQRQGWVAQWGTCGSWRAASAAPPRLPHRCRVLHLKPDYACSPVGHALPLVLKRAHKHCRRGSGGSAHALQCWEGTAWEIGKAGSTGQQAAGPCGSGTRANWLHRKRGCGGQQQSSQPAGCPLGCGATKHKGCPPES